MTEQNQQLAQLTSKYQSVLSFVKQQPDVRLQNVHIEGGKLLIRATTPSAEVKNRIWDQIKLVDSSFADLTADITVDSSGSSSSGDPARRTESRQSYTVKAGDTLSKISQEFYGDAKQYNKIFEANRDQLSDPDKIRPGQTLKIPA